MKTKLLFQAILLFTMINYTTLRAQSWGWARSASGNQYDQSSTVATDPSGNVIVAGYFASDSLIIGNITLYNSSIGFDDLFIAKYDSSGNLLWAQSAGSSDDDKATSLATDAQGNIFLAGYFKSPTITFGTFMLGNAGNGDICLVKYNNAGNVLWAKSEGGLSLEIPYSLTVDTFGNLMVTGRFSSNTVIFGTTTLTQAGSMDVFLVKYNSSGNVVWAKGAGGGSNDEAYSVKTDALGNIYLAGYFNQTFTIGTFNLTTSGQADFFIAKYDSSGTVLWANKAGGNGDDRCTGVAVDANGNVYISGWFASTAFTIGSLTLNNSGGYNSMIASFDASGNYNWAFGIDGDSRAQGLIIKNATLYAGGYFHTDTLHYGGTSLYLEGNYDLYLLSCDLSGNKNWIIKQTSGGSSSEFANSIASGAGGSIYIAGYFDSDPITFGSSTISNTGNGFDMFLAKLGTASTGLETFEENSSITLYPNPANESVFLDYDKDISLVEIYSINGSLIHSFNSFPKSTTIQLNIADLSAGIYFLKVSGKDKSSIRKFVIQ